MRLNWSHMEILSTLFPLFTTLYTIPGSNKFSELTFEDINGTTGSISIEILKLKGSTSVPSWFYKKRRVQLSALPCVPLSSFKPPHPSLYKP